MAVWPDVDPPLSRNWSGNTTEGLSIIEVERLQ